MVSLARPIALYVFASTTALTLSGTELENGRPTTHTCRSVRASSGKVSPSREKSQYAVRTASSRLEKCVSISEPRHPSGDSRMNVSKNALTNTRTST